MSSQNALQLSLNALVLDASEDDEWRELHTWASDFRKEKRLTCQRLLELCGLSANSYFLQLLSTKGKGKHVSPKKGTMGFALRNALEKAKANPPDTSNSPPPSARMLIEEVILEHGDNLRKRGISEILIDEDTHEKVLLTVLLTELKDSTKSDNGIINDLKPSSVEDLLKNLAAHLGKLDISVKLYYDIRIWDEPLGNQMCNVIIHNYRFTSCTRIGQTPKSLSI